MDNLINQKALEYANSKLDKNCAEPVCVQLRMRQFDWADIANAFEAGAKWIAKLPPYNVVLSPPTFKPTLDEKKMREILESSEMHSRFNIQEYIEQENLKRAFVQDSNGDMMRKP